MMSPLSSLGLTLADSVPQLFAKLADRLPAPESKAACVKVGEVLRDDWLCVNIASLTNPEYTAEEMVNLFESNGAKGTWVKGLQFMIDHRYPPRPGGGVPLSAALVPSAVTDPVRPSSSRIISAPLPDTYITFPTAKIMAAITETPDVRLTGLTYSDTKAVMKEIYLWEVTQRHTVASRKNVAKEVAQKLYDLWLQPYGKNTWTQKILDRKKNGRRSNAKVAHPFALNPAAC